MADDNPTDLDGQTSDPIVSCDSCTNRVHLSTTEEVRRTYMDREFPERWCEVCVASTRAATERRTEDDEPDY